MTEADLESQLLPKRERARLPLLLLLLFAAGTTWLSPFERDLFVGDETRYGRVVYEMKSSGDYLVPRLGGEPYAHKPPLHFWMILLARLVVGEGSILSFALPSLLSFLGSVLLIGWWGKHRFGAVGGIAAATMFASFWLSWGSAQSARMDHTYALLTTVAAILIGEYFNGKRRWQLITAGVVAGVATLVKGPMVIVIVITLFALESFRRRRRPDRWSLVAFLLMAVIVLAWLIPAVVTGGGSYGEEMLVDQSIGRAFSSWVHAEPPWFYLLHAPVTFFPWSIVLVVALWSAWRARKSDEVAPFLLSWFASIFIPYSLISGKLDIYMLPAMAPCALMLGWLFMQTRWNRSWKWSAIVVSAVLAVAAFGANVAIPFLDHTDPDVAPWIVPEVRLVLWITTVVAAVGVALAMSRDRARSWLVAITGIVALTPIVALLTLGIETANEESSTRRLVRVLERSGVPAGRISMHWTPYLWSTEMSPRLHDVHYGYPEEAAEPPLMVVVRRDHTDDIAGQLEGYERYETVRMISKEFDVYRRER